MAKESLIQRDAKRARMTKRFAMRRRALKNTLMNKTIPIEERFSAQLKLAALPRNGSATRCRNRCALTGRARGYYRKFHLSRIVFRRMANEGLIPGVVKASW